MRFSFSSRDFRTPLMPIQANSNKNSNQSQRHQSQQQQQQQQTQSQLVQQQQQQQQANQQQLLQQQQHQLQQQQQQRSHHTSSHHNHHHNSASGHHYHHHHHHHHHQASSENQYPLEPATIALTASPHEDALQKLTQRLESELRIAKRQHLACTEVLLPADLLPRISSQMFELSEKEPCGIRGCTIYIEFEDEPDNTRRIATMKTDPNTVSTFELYLTLKQDRRGWTSILPQFLKNLARGSTIMISPEFVLTKNKLYHAYSD
ncbi:protein charybde-like isoform X2 [Anopheles ziemanni]|uniref:protein charybde-like isoform X2 n=1 Tax=Anopheles coustani TaxID=139045 RepID=UPI002659DFD3|nr:protein charybde-like isoform X2 [Anopheles coustani]XP_058174656.1 protein charybde-like isoform X2 [Anopheles ziemanni]